MANRKRDPELSKKDYSHLRLSYNDSNPSNPSHDVDTPTSFNLKTITLEDIDQAVWQEFEKRFRIMDKELSLFSGDAEVASIPMQNYEHYDEQKQMFNWPFFIYTRKETNKVMRTNPTYKPIAYVIPKTKAQGVVFEEYRTEAPVNYELIYEFKFVTNFREACNQMEEQMNYYFRNKRNIIVLDGERFSIGPVNKDKLGELEIVSRDQAGEMTMYVITFNLKLWCYTRDASTMQKKERPNTYTIDLIVKDNKGQEVDSTRDTIYRDRFEADTSSYPKNPSSDPEPPKPGE